MECLEGVVGLGQPGTGACPRSSYGVRQIGRGVLRLNLFFLIPSILLPGEWPEQDWHMTVNTPFPFLELFLSWAGHRHTMSIDFRI